MRQKALQKLYCSGTTETFHSSLPHLLLLLWDLLHLTNQLHFTVNFPSSFFLCAPFKGCGFLAKNIQMYNNNKYHLHSKNINILHQRPTSPEPHCAQGWVSPQQIQCRSVWLHWEPVFHFTGWTGWCYISDISLSVTTESIGSPWNSTALGAPLTV